MPKAVPKAAAAMLAENGFSLVDVLVSACLLAGAVAVLLHVLVFASRAHADARSATVAAILAAQKMEELRAMPAASGPMDASDYADAHGVVLATGTAAVPFYRRRWTMQPSPVAMGAVVVTVTVTRAGAPGTGIVRLIAVRSRPDAGRTTESE